MPMPYSNGMQMGAPSDWTAQHELYKNELASSIRANAESHQLIADRFNHQVQSLRDEHHELAGKVKAAHTFNLNQFDVLHAKPQNVNYYQQSHQLDARQSHFQPSLHINGVEVSSPADDTPVDAAQIEDAGWLLENAANVARLNHIQQELAENAQGSTTASPIILASQDAAIMSGHGSNLATGTSALPPVPNTLSGGGSGRARVMGVGAASTGLPELENGSIDEPTVFNTPQPPQRRSAHRDRLSLADQMRPSPIPFPIPSQKKARPLSEVIPPCRTWRRPWSITFCTGPVLCAGI